MADTRPPLPSCKPCKPGDYECDCNWCEKHEVTLDICRDEMAEAARAERGRLKSDVESLRDSSVTRHWDVEAQRAAYSDLSAVLAIIDLAASESRS